MATFFKFQDFSEQLIRGIHDFDAHTFKVYLSNAAPSASADAVKADLAEISAGNGYTAGGNATTITVAIDSTTFSTFTTGGSVNTRPQAGEAVTGGCEFDIPCRFNSAIDLTHLARWVRETGQIDLVELLNP